MYLITRRIPRAVQPLVFKAAYSNKFSMESRPGPPPLPKEQQEEFERLQKIASSQIAIEEYNSKVTGEDQTLSPVVEEKTTIGSFVNTTTIPEFEGDVNPETGEIGGPKQDPTRHGDWAFNGRVTDF